MNKPREICVYLGGLARTPALCIVTFTICAFVGFLCWPIELFAHFRVQYIVLLAIAIPYLAFLEHSRTNRLYLLVAIVALVANIVVVTMASVSFGEPSLSSANQTDQTKVSLLQFNVNSSSTNYPAFDRLIEKTKPDIICVEEVSEGWGQHFAKIKNLYPYQAVRARPDNFGIGILSKFKIEHESREPIGGIGLPTMFVDLSLPNDPKLEKNSENKIIQVIATHPLPPVSPGATAMRDKQLHELAKRISDSKKITLLAGDFNATPWCYIFQDMVKESGLIDSRLNKGIQPSWPTMLVPLLIPIDHILMSPSIKCTERSVEQHSGSDHFPVFAKFII